MYVLSGWFTTNFVLTVRQSFFTSVVISLIARHLADGHRRRSVGDGFLELPGTMRWLFQSNLYSRTTLRMFQEELWWAFASGTKCVVIAMYIFIHLIQAPIGRR